MKITDIRALSHSDFPNVLHLEIETDEGVTGLGETYYFASTVAHFIKDFVAPNIVGKNPLAREEISRILTTYVGYNGSGVETRARSAVDIALWDIAGKVAGKPIYELLGGSPRSVPIYNTCAGKEYMRRSDQSSQSWGIDSSSTDLEDLKAFMTDAGTLAEELISEGISGMKIWPFDLFAEKNWGSEISLSDLRAGLEPIHEIRDRVGSKMKIMVELHALWSPASAREIMVALKDYDIFWVEDPIHPDRLDELELLRGDGLPPIAHGETIASRYRVEQLVRRGLIDYLTLDLSWCGGLTEGLEFARLASENGVKIAPHDCTGPIGLTIGSHLSVADPNSSVQETVRAAFRTWYPHLVTELPVIRDGLLFLNDSPGLGTQLRPEYRHSFGLDHLAIVR